MKLDKIAEAIAPEIVVPHAGTWIEIVSDGNREYIGMVVPHAGTWIEILY